MTTTITYGTTSTSPYMLLGYRTTVQKPIRLHAIIGRGDPDVTLSETGTRSGTLSCFYAEEGEALAALDVLRQVGTFTLTDTDLPDIGMTFVASSLSLRYDQKHWVLDVTYTEVLS